MLACGQQHAAHLATELRFSDEALAGIAELDGMRDDFVNWLAGFQFTGDIVALPEGTPVFPDEPILEVTAPIAEAQLLETLLMNTVHLETVLASRAARFVLAADGRPVVDFGMRRMHGTDAAVQGVRAFRTAGIAATSHVLAGLHYGLPVRGTMAHSFIQAHDDETDAFRRYVELYPGTTLLVDTYDTLAGIDKVIALRDEMGEAFSIGAIRLDSGDLATLAHAARERLDGAGLDDVQIFASGGLDEERIDALVRGGAPIDAFGVGTQLGTAADAPSVDLAYKLTEYDGKPRLKTSPGKAIWPGRKQVYRMRDAHGGTHHDELVSRDETRDGEALLEPVVTCGDVIHTKTCDLEAARNHAGEEIGRLPAHLREITPGEAPFELRVADSLRKLRAAAE
ncbi:MAG: nicotinate phosphoribosyltransferase [Gammaproteobacteria bacterium]|nr:nicotinate phosphoribosyltransferase [Gammaproteobacteria bacterium]